MIHCEVARAGIVKICEKSEVVNKSVECESWQTSKVVVVDRKKGSGAAEFVVQRWSNRRSRSDVLQAAAIDQRW